MAMQGFIFEAHDFGDAIAGSAAEDFLRAWVDALPAHKRAELHRAVVSWRAGEVEPGDGILAELDEAEAEAVYAATVGWNKPVDEAGVAVYAVTAEPRTEVPR